ETPKHTRTHRTLARSAYATSADRGKPVRAPHRRHVGTDISPLGDLPPAQPGDLATPGPAISPRTERPRRRAVRTACRPGSGAANSPQAPPRCPTPRGPGTRADRPRGHRYSAPVSDDRHAQAAEILGATSVARTRLGSADSQRASRRWWDADADDYHRTH